MPDATLIPKIREAVNEWTATIASEMGRVVDHAEGWRDYSRTADDLTKNNVSEPLVKDWDQRGTRFTALKTALGKVLDEVSDLEKDGFPKDPRRVIPAERLANLEDQRRTMGISIADVEVESLEAESGTVVITPEPKL